MPVQANDRTRSAFSSLGSRSVLAMVMTAVLSPTFAEAISLEEVHYDVDSDTVDFRIRDVCPGQSFTAVRKQCNLRPKAAPQGEVDSPGCEFNLVPSADERCPDRSFVGVAKLPVDKFLAVMPESIETIRVTLQSRYVPATEKGNQVGTIIRHSAAARARSRIYAQSESRAVIDCKTTQASIYHLNSQREPVCVLKESCTSLSVTKDSALTSAVIDSALACQKTNTCGSSVAFSEPHWFYCSVENCNDAHQCADDSTQPNSIAANDIVSSKLLPLTDTSGPSGAGRADGTDGAAANSGYGAATGKSGNPRAPRTKSVQ